MGGVAETNIRVFYNTLGTPETYRLMRSVCPQGMELVFLDSDDTEERCLKIAECDAVLVAATPLTREIMDSATKLRLVQHQGVGYHDTVDIDSLIKRDIPLALTITEAATTAVAEHTVLLALAACRRLPFVDSELRKGRWHTNTFRPVSTGLNGKTIGYVGMGRIARAAARRFLGFGTRGLYFDPSVKLEDACERELGIEPSSFESLLAIADIITLHVPLTADTRNLLSHREFASMKEDAVVVNTCRGGVIDEEALAAALKSGRIGAAGLDVFNEEPPSDGSLFKSLENIVLTPHISAGTREVFQGKIASALQNIASFFKGLPLNEEVKLSSESR